MEGEEVLQTTSDHDIEGPAYLAQPPIFRVTGVTQETNETLARVPTMILSVAMQSGRCARWLMAVELCALRRS